MQLGDFTKLAKHYVNRPGYSTNLLSIIRNHIMIDNNVKNIVIADVGAGTGKLTENLFQIGLSGFAVEPNDAMRAEGIAAFDGIKEFEWKKGSAENTGLADNSVDWVIMGSSFHWTDSIRALEEFYRILKPGGFFTAIWNPRDIEKSELHTKIENNIKAMVPDLKRVSSGSAKNMQGMESTMMSSGLFKDLFFMEAPHIEVMSKERYIGAWMSVNDIQVQAGEARFKQIIEMIEDEIKSLEDVKVPYKSRAWTVKSSK